MSHHAGASERVPASDVTAAHVGDDVAHAVDSRLLVGFCARLDVLPHVHAEPAGVHGLAPRVERRLEGTPERRPHEVAVRGVVPVPR